MIGDFTPEGAAQSCVVSEAGRHLGAAVAFQEQIGRAAIERRVRELALYLARELSRIDGVTLWTRMDADTSAAIVVFKPAGLEPRRVAATLYERDRIACAIDRP